MFAMLHLKCFRALWDRGRGGGMGTGVRWVSGGHRRSGRDFYFRSIPIHGVGSCSIPYVGTGGFTKGTGVRTHSRAGCPAEPIMLWSFYLLLLRCSYTAYPYIARLNIFTYVLKAFWFMASAFCCCFVSAW